MSEWKPIESAPKDGTWVLCYGTVEDDTHIDARRVFTAQYTNFLNGSLRENYWWQFAWFDGGYYGRCDPTHWQPLPLPPQEEV